ncbi:hypothetical protein IAD21_02320 [Abditibacteriota bacterium]|nr:hypothetical protein IAD21_02320 [Abditibacteriota bacterium]
MMIVGSNPDLEADFDAARAKFASLVGGLPSRVSALFDVDADGVAAAGVFERVLERAGHPIQTVLPDRERNAWTPENRRRLVDTQPEFTFILDLGSRGEKVLDGIPACFIDHHRPEGTPEGDTLISGYEWEPIPNTSWMVFELGSAVAHVEDLDWIAVIGTLSDLGERAPWPLIEICKKKYTAKWLKEATALVNAARRASDFRPEVALQALREHSNPKEFCESGSSSAQALRAAREEVKAAMNEGKKAAPKFAGEVALIQVNSPCQIHPLIAQIWRGRLPKFHVIAANTGYMPNRVNFSARSAKDKSVLDFLKSLDAGEGEGYFGHGHDQASGGSLPPERWERLKRAMGF